MKALILVGGYGNRLRPLTLTVPKPLVEFANKPLLCHQIEGLAKAGVSQIFLSINYQQVVMQEEIKQYESEVSLISSLIHLIISIVQRGDQMLDREGTDGYCRANRTRSR